MNPSSLQDILQTGLLLWVLVWDLIAFILMGADKWRAKHRKWRVRERTLFLSAVLGGSLGAILGMHLFRHKTEMPSFRIGMPLILAAQVLLLLSVFCWRTFVH